MTKPYKKKLIEVAIPLEAINKASAREKSIRHGHPSTLHLWWARRPLAACRAVLFAQLVDDPSSHPEKFPTKEDQEKERERLFKIMEELVQWKNSTDERVLSQARKEIETSCCGILPDIYDPFSGGCSIPLEAQRLGLRAHGSDLNPIAVVIGKAMIEIPPKFKDMKPVHPGGPERNDYRNTEGLSEDVRFYGEWMRNLAFDRIGDLYPQVRLPEEHGGSEANVIAWIWARTVPSPDPAFDGIEVPIVSNFLLSTKKDKHVWIEPVIDKSRKTIEFRIRHGGTKTELEKAKQGTRAGTGANFRCLVSESAITAEYIREQAQSGNMGQRLIAIAAQGRGRRAYIPPSHEQELLALRPDVQERARAYRELFLSGDTPSRLTGGTCHGYGLDSWGKLFTDRQVVALSTLGGALSEVAAQVEKDAKATKMASKDETPLCSDGNGARAYAEAVVVYLAFAISRSADRGSTLCTWDSSPKMEALRNTFGRQSLPMTWDFAEGNPFSSASGNFLNNVTWVSKVIEKFVPSAYGEERQADAQSLSYPNNVVLSSDPPYYDNIAYADLSDFFFCWLKPSLKDIYSDLFGFLATPKSEELVATAYRHGGRDAAETFFLEGMRNAITNMADQTSPDFPATIYYAFKQSEVKAEGVASTGWATFLQAVIEAGYSVVGTWPLRTEMANRMIASGTNALANSVVLVCRKRKIEAEEITRAEFLRSLKQELPPALYALQNANITPVDMPQASIGPGIGVFSRYKRVIESDDSQMSVKTALQLINRELDDFLNQQEGEFDPDTRFAVSWFEQNGMEEGSFGDADNLARARGLSVDSVKHAGIVKAGAGKVRLLKRDELEEKWSPANDTHLTIWECTQYLIHALENDGEYAAAVLLRQMDPDTADAARDLAYRLHDVCSNKRKDAKEATSYNSLIAVWPDLTAQAATISDADIGESQLSML